MLLKIGKIVGNIFMSTLSTLQNMQLADKFPLTQ